jgi:hypothetical protein
MAEQNTSSSPRPSPTSSTPTQQPIIGELIISDDEKPTTTRTLKRPRAGAAIEFLDLFEAYAKKNRPFICKIYWIQLL